MSKILYIVHCIDTEGPLNESIIKTFQRLKSIFDLTLKPTKKNLIKIFLIVLLLLLIIFIYSKIDQKKVTQQTILENKEAIYITNIIKDVNYTSKDQKGNEFILKADQGEIDPSDDNIIFLKNVRAVIKIKDKNDVNISSDYGKYNINNYETIFSKNVIITYIDHKINSNYADFSFNRNLMIISKDVTYTDLESMLKADLIEINIETKDTRISMYEQNKKVNIKSKD